MSGITTLCRLCLDKQGECSLHENNLVDIIYALFNIKMELVSHLPSQICKQCFDVLHNARELRELAIKSHYKLNYVYKKNHHIAESVSEKEINSVSEETEINSCNVLPEEPEEEIVTTNIKNTVDTIKRRSASPRISPKWERHEKSPDIGVSNHCPIKITVRKDLFTTHTGSYSRSEERFRYKKTAVTHSEVLVHPHVKIRRREDEDPILVCHICNKVFHKWKKFYLHQRTHTKTYACPIKECNKNFATKGDLEKHIRVHTGERPYECWVCFKRFTQRCTLKSHIENVHSKIFTKISSAASAPSNAPNTQV